MIRIALVCLAVVSLSGCVAVAIPLTAAASGAMSDRAISRTEDIAQMNCSELREKWAEVSSPGAVFNPTRLIAAERSMVRTTAQRRG